MSLPTAVVQRAADADTLHARMAGVAARLNRAHGELVELMAEALETDLWAEGGIRSPEHWLCVRAGVSPARARDIVRLASRRGEMGQALELMDEGRLSVDQAVVVARHVPTSYVASALELAPLTTVRQLHRAMSRYSFTEQGEGRTDDLGRPTEHGADTGPSDVDESARLSMSTACGRFELRFGAPADLGALVERAVREARDALFAAGQSRATLADGLLEVARRSLAGAAAGSRASHCRVHVFLDEKGGWVGAGGRLPAHMLDRATCDGSVRPVWTRDGTPVSVGRTTRIVPERLRTLVVTRDMGCRYPGCGVGAGHVDVHHIVHWRDGGATSIDNLVCLCSYHHDRHHDGEFAIAGDPTRPDGLRFTGRGGLPVRPLTGAGVAEDAFETGRPDPRPWGGPLGETLQSRWLTLVPDPSQAGPPVLGCARGV